ncbi:MAG: hypothetical protein LBJ12_09880 [Oscillospiraceae bacterium]|jgi:hypothetical protein|nr:hypothetical protein [Oscillospiraceae bacterium]
MKKKLIAIIVAFALVIGLGATGFIILNQPKIPPTAEETAKEIFPLIPQNEIYGVIESNFYIPYDITIPENTLLESDVLVRAKVISAEPTQFLPESETYYGADPVTPLKLQVLEVLSGEIESKTITAYFPGGSVTAEEYLTHRPTSGKKMGLSNLSQKDRKKQYIQLSSELDYNGFKTNTEYVIVLKECVEDFPGTYFVSLGGYSIFTTDKKNVKTQKELKSTKAGKAKVATNPALEK